MASNKQEVLERTNLPTFLTLFNNTVSVALFNYGKKTYLGFHGDITYHGYCG
jgi:hypothetical protein